MKTMRVLVGYASRFGSTREVAMRIADALRVRGNDVDLRAVEEIADVGDAHPIVGGLIKKEPREIGEFERTLHRRGYRVFAGVIDLDQWPAWGRLMFKALGGRAGDNRQWPDIDAWAEQIARVLETADNATAS